LKTEGEIMADKIVEIMDNAYADNIKVVELTDFPEILLKCWEVCRDLCELCRDLLANLVERYPDLNFDEHRIAIGKHRNTIAMMIVEVENENNN